MIIFKDDYEYKLKDKNKCVSHRGEAKSQKDIIIKTNMLNFTIIIHQNSLSEAHDIEGISDVMMN